MFPLEDMYVEAIELLPGQDGAGDSVADMFGDGGGAEPKPIKDPRIHRNSQDSLEDMLMGMSLDDMNMFGGGGGMPGSFGGLPGSNSFGSLRGETLDYLLGPMGGGGGASPVEVPLSPAQRIKRDRSSSTVRGHAHFTYISRSGNVHSPPEGASLGSSWGGFGGSMNPHAHQRLRQGPGPGSLPPASLTPSLGDTWSGPSSLESKP